MRYRNSPTTQFPSPSLLRQECVSPRSAPYRPTCIRSATALLTFVALFALAGEVAAAFSVGTGGKAVANSKSELASPPSVSDLDALPHAAPVLEEKIGARDEHPLGDASDDSVLGSSRRGFLRASATSVAAAAAAAAVMYSDPDPVEAYEGRANTASKENDAPPSSSTLEAAGGTVVATSATATTSVSVGGSAPQVDFKAILDKSAKRALGGGKAGASAAVVQVFSLMWLRTAMNYQYRYGGDLVSSLRTLTSEGGIPRLYQGLPFALVQGPLTKFGDTAANTGVLALLEAIPETAALPLPLRTLGGSVAAGLWRIFCMPIDTSKTAMQVEGSEGLDRLKERVMEEGPSPLYQGALASAAATAAGHYPWFLTYNFLSDTLPTTSKEELLLVLVRSAFIGLSASCVSDCVSNSLRVIKTTKQTAGLSAGTTVKASAGDNGSENGEGRAEATLPMEVEEGKRELTYREALDIILEKDGVKGLFGRGLKTRLLTNAIQGAAFSVLWKYFQTVGAQ